MMDSPKNGSAVKTCRIEARRKGGESRARLSSNRKNRQAIASGGLLRDRDGLPSS